MKDEIIDKLVYTDIKRKCPYCQSDKLSNHVSRRWWDEYECGQCKRQYTNSDVALAYIHSLLCADCFKEKTMALFESALCVVALSYCVHILKQLKSDS